MKAADLSGAHLGKVLTRHKGGFTTANETLTITSVEHRLATVIITTTSPTGETDKLIVHANAEIGEPT